MTLFAGAWLISAGGFPAAARQVAVTKEDPATTASENAQGTQGQPVTDKAAQEQPAPGQPQPNQNPPAQAPPAQNPPVQSQPPPSGTSKDRLFFVMPNFLTLENGEHVPPLTSGQKFKVVARSTFDPFQFCYYIVIAGIGQAADSESGYGQGAQGYGKRLGAIFADTTIENFMVGAILPSVLHQDPRYFQKGKGSFGSRTWYALTRFVVTRGDNGHAQFNASEVFGSAMAAAISTYSYHPESDRKIGNLATTWGTQLALDSFGFMMKEFWPDMKRHFQKKKAAAGAGNS